MKLSDYVIDFLVREGIRHVFVISGGAILHCVDSAAKNPNIQYICTQHEQGAGAAADAYSRITENLGATLTTSGPGTTNLVTSVCNAYFDSIPAIFISGQVATFRIRPNEKLRQKGFQETDMVSIFESITKYAKLVTSADDIKHELQKAVYLAKSGRPGPVLLDIPDDIQRVEIDPDTLSGFDMPVSAPTLGLDKEIKKIFSHIESAARPVLILGAGVRIAHAKKEALKFARCFNLPVLLTWGAMDLMARDDELNMGGLGVCGPRAGNFAAQNSDLVIAIGTRLSQMITGGKQNLFAPKAKKIMIDIDAEELKKFTPKEFTLDLALECHLTEFFNTCQNLYQSPSDHFEEWRDQIRAWDKQYPVCPSEYYDRKDKVDAHVFVKELSHACKEGDIILTDAGGNLSWTMQAFEVKENQRLLSAWNHSPMGYSMPAAIGAALAGKKDVICIIGDGGLMMCLQELGTIKRYNLPVKIFLFNNHCHGIQKQTLDTWLNSHYVAVDEKTGLYFPDFLKMGEVFGFKTSTIENHSKLQDKIREVLRSPGCVLCNVEIFEEQKIVPMLKFGAGLEDLDPKIAREELAEIMRLADLQKISSRTQKS